MFRFFEMWGIRKAKRRAARGGRWLDFTKPDWFLTIDADRIKIASEDLCVGAQTLGNGDYRHSGLGHSGWACRRGFVANCRNTHELDAAWRIEVISRRTAFNEAMGMSNLPELEAVTDGSS